MRGMDFLELAKKRFSVKKYADRQVEQEKMDLILEAAKIAPTARNAQAFKIYVLQSPEALEKAKALTACVYGANTVLLFCYDDEKEYKNPYEEGPHSGDQDCSIVATHVMLQAAELGIGTCWVNNFHVSDTAKAFELPENEKPVLLMPIGYAEEGFAPLPKHTEYRDLSELVEYR